MTVFIDGPAADVVLYLRHAPDLLRVVHSEKRGWDGLDEAGDRPHSDETITLYARQGAASYMHVRRRGGGGIYRSGRYVLVQPQPSEETLRDAAKWRAYLETRS